MSISPDGSGRPIRVGIVGCGEVSQIVHLPTLAQLAADFRVTALCDVSPTVLRVVGDAWGVEHRTDDFAALVARDDVDAVLVANPNAFHAEVTLLAAAAGKHVLVEKPMAITLREADAVIEAQRRHGVVVQVGYMRRYAPAFVEAVRRVRDLGPVRLASVHDVIGQNALVTGQIASVVRGADVPAEAIQAARASEARLLDEAIGDVELDLRRTYGLLLGLSSHDVSAMRELLGRPQGVLYAAQRHGGSWITAAFDYGSFVCHFETGVDTVPRYDTYLEAHGDQEVLRVRYQTPYVRHLPTQLEIVRGTDGGAGLAHESVQPSWADPFVEEWRAFAASIRTGAPVKTSPADYREDLELFAAMMERLVATGARSRTP